MKKQIYMNRELSWLKFNERVLEEAERKDNPLCERLSFASIYQSNMDEFFMVRIGSLIDQKNIDKKLCENKTGMTPGEQIRAASEQVKLLNKRRDAVYNELVGKLSEQGVTFVDFKNISKKESNALEEYFDEEIAPLLFPAVVGKKQPFPFLKNKEIYAVASLMQKNGKYKMGIISCGTGVFPRLICVSEKTGTYMLSEELILHFMPKLFKDYTIIGKSLIRITRNADIDADALYDDGLDYREFMKDIIKKRRKLKPVRLEISGNTNRYIEEKLCNYLDIPEKYIYTYNSPLDLSFVFQIRDMLRKKTQLFYEKRFPQQSSQFVKDLPILEQIKKKDKFLSYPYDSIKPFLTMLHEAANDKDVVSIKMTLYRVAKESEVVEALIEAAENGKNVLVLVELKARFDEENNIGWSRRLEEAGCTVIYGLEGYKVHSKLCLITKNTAKGIEYYTQTGTGNYNEKTARLYTDYALMTYNQTIGKDADNVFTALSNNDTVKKSKELMVAPECLQSRIIEMIDKEIAKGKNGYIGMKVNSVTDKKIIDKIIEASKAGLKIDIIVRGICCLIPGVKNETENIRVISVVGRFLEHSRVYLFGKDKEQKIYISSADLMTRNMLKRVEIAAPVYDNDIRNQIIYMFNTMLNDNCQARELKSDGNYKHVINESAKVNSQELFYQKAYEQAAGNKKK